ncbi:hypothetical protein ASF94_08320 [Acidovorax sp. Leaf160]|nr:hypothetical protein ASF94_08320 [Acidovorax sp. Leaf160]
MSSIFSSARARWALRAVGCAALVFLLLLAAGRWLVPVVLKSQLEQRGSQQLGRAVTIRQVDFKPWSLELELHDLAVANAEGEGAQLHIKRIYIDAALQSLVRLAPVLDALRVEEPVFRWAQTSPGRYDIDDVIERLAEGRGNPAPESAQAPARLALYNLTVSGGVVDYEDRVAGQRQSLRDVSLAVPFLSTLPVHREVKVNPRLAFEWNGSPFETTAEATPFAADRRADVRLQVQHFDLAPFTPYLPASLPLRVQSGRLDVDLKVAFEQAATPSVAISGVASVKDAKLLDLQGREVAAFDAVHVRVRDLQPLQRHVHLDAVEGLGVHVELRRGADGALDLPRAPAADRPGEPSAGVLAQSAEKADGSTATRVGEPWRIEVDSASLRQASVGWTDQAAGGARWQARGVNVSSSAIAWPLKKPLQLQAEAEVSGDTAPGQAARLTLAGQATASSASAAVSLRGLPLELASPYLQAHLRPRVSGAVDADLGLAWNGSTWLAKLARLSARDVAVSCGAQTAACAATLAEAGMSRAAPRRLADWRSLTVEDAWVRPGEREVRIGRLTWAEPRVHVSRDAEGRWAFQDWLAPSPVAAKEAPAPAAPGDRPWTVTLSESTIEGGAVAFRDAAAVRPVAVDLSSLQVRLRDFTPLAMAAPSAPPAPSALSLSARVGAGRFEPGRLAYEGTLRAAPLQLQGRVQASHLPLQALEPYVADQLNVRIARAEGGFSGDLSVSQTERGTSVTARGDATLDELRVRGTEASDGASASDTTASVGGARRNDLLRWKSLGLHGVDLAVSPGRPLALQVQETALTDFFARVVLQENGRVNLQEAFRPQTPNAPPAAPAARETTAAGPATGGDGGSAQGPVLAFGPITLSGGSVQFSDRFVKPNYSADLTELAGRLSAFSSVTQGAGGEVPMADLELRGKAEGTATVEISGKVNPLAQPLALDIRGRMRDLDLPALSPYSVKYAGHGIERGKLTMDVNYRVLPNGELTASNRLVLRQLVFGEAVEGAPASLPVRLAVALLADRNGVIDVDLPISGSLNDPQFSLGSVIWKVLGNLIVKAVTSPFALLTGGFGGSEELDKVEFQPGSAVLQSPAQARLDTVAKALADRPALSLTVVGEAALEAERNGWKRERLQDLVASEKRRAAAQAGQDTGQLGPVTEAEYLPLLREAYRRADITKPRNLVGMAKDVPQQEMESLLLANIAVPQDAMRQLAIARGVAVRDYLAAQSIATDRLFLGAPRPTASGDGWTPHAELRLGRR